VAAQVRAGARPARIGVPVAHGIADAPARAPESGLLTEWWGPRQRFVCFETGPAQWSWVSVGATRTQGWDATVAALIAATPADARWHAGPVRVARGGAWTRGRVALLGEAAHPSGGSGGQDAAQALLDAAALSRALATHPDVEVALSAYAGARRPAATRQQALAARLDRLGRLGGPLSCRLREWLIRLTWEQVALPQLVRSLAPDAGELATPTTSGSLPAHSA
jgi:2-polyprenyl-6-methoxyphenol hydroxylase-like FAD-dependent oxidoreductase